VTPLQGLLSRWARTLLSFMFFFVVAFGAMAQEQQPVPPLKGRVTDLTGTLTVEQTASLDQSLRAYEDRKGVQLAVLIVPTARPEAIEQFALRVAEQWKLGRRKVDDGALLLVAKDDREIRLEVGYGIEGALNDVAARRVIAEVITPRFRQGDIFGGIAAGMERVQHILDGETLPAPQQRSQGDNEIGKSWPVLFFVAIALGSFLRRILGRLPGALVAAGILGVIAWFAIGTLVVALIAGLAGFFVTLLGVGVGGLGGHHSSGGWSGGGGGGGFRGGGGGFGGGGASGRW